MAEYIFFISLVCLAILGLSEIIHIAKKIIYSSAKHGKRIIILVVSNEEFHNEIMNLYFDFKWQGYNFAKQIFIDDSNVNEENREELNFLIQKTGFEILNSSVFRK